MEDTTPKPAGKRRKYKPGKSELKYTLEEVKAALESTKGAVYLAAAKLACSPQTIYAYMERFPELARITNDEREKRTDVAELKLYEAVMRGEPWAIKIQLMQSRNGRSRGFGPQQEQQEAGKETVIRVIHEEKATEE